jgi:ferredoxin-NADP reductase
MVADALATSGLEMDRQTRRPPVTSAFDVRLVARQDVAAATMAFHFTRPAGFHFRAGQAVTLTLLSPPITDSKGDRRTFSIASAPSADDMVIVSRMRESAFKRVLRTMPLGTTVRMRGPFGKFVIAPNEKAIVMLAGGIGITPFLSMVRDALDVHDGRTVHLFYANRAVADAAFLQELRDAARHNLRFRFIPAVSTACDADLWDGELGSIDHAMLERHLTNWKDPAYYIAGPPGMVTALQRLLANIGVAPDRLHTDEFYGY